MKTKFLTLTVLTLLFVLACNSESDDIYIEDSSFMEIPENQPVYLNIPIEDRTIFVQPNGNDMLKSSEQPRLVVQMAEYYTIGNNGPTGKTIIFGTGDRGNKRGYSAPNMNSPLDTHRYHFPQALPAGVPPSLLPPLESIYYYVDENRPAPGLTTDETNQAIHNAMNTWNEVTCSDFGMTEVPYDGAPSGIILGEYEGFDAEWGNLFKADIYFGGWVSGDLFDQLAEGGSDFILGVTFTAVWVDGDLPVDNDKDGIYDAFFREIYFNENLTWSTDGSGNQEGIYDVETVALHEAGHGLSQGHFGKHFENRGGMHYGPKTIMDPFYSEIQTEIGKTDEALHCRIWRLWPN